MPRRIIAADGEQWEVAVSGRIDTVREGRVRPHLHSGLGPDREQRVTRYSPLGAKSRELSLAS